MKDGLKIVIDGSKKHGEGILKGVKLTLEADAITAERWRQSLEELLPVLDSLDRKDIVRKRRKARGDERGGIGGSAR